MKLESSRDLPLAQQRVWEILNDTAVLQRCIPGCETLEVEPDGSMTATVRAKIGPVSARFSGKVVFEDVVVPESYRLVFSGQGGAAGFAKGHTQVRLEPIPDGTRLNYVSEASVGGKLAQIGSRLVESSARKLADEFFSRLEAEMRGNPSASAGNEGGSDINKVDGAMSEAGSRASVGQEQPRLPGHGSRASANGSSVQVTLPGWVAWGSRAGWLALVIAVYLLLR